MILGDFKDCSWIFSRGSKKTKIRLTFLPDIENLPSYFINSCVVVILKFICCVHSSDSSPAY